MKVKITLLITSIDNQRNITDDKRCLLYLDDDCKLPSRYVSTRSVDDTVKEVIGANLNLDPDWLQFFIAGFRTLNISEVEAVYVVMTPRMSGANKIGGFFSPVDLQKMEIELDDYYNELSARASQFRQ